MSSILKVDQLQDSGGNSIISSNGSGTFTSSLPNTGITMADQWRLTSNFSSDNNPITANLERNDSTGFNYLGSGMSQSSGIFTFPETGYYLVSFHSEHYINGVDREINARIGVTTNNSTYSDVARGATFVNNSTIGNNTHTSAECSTIVDVTDTSNVKVRLVYLQTKVELQLFQIQIQI